jgi:hypothetical protein
VQEVVASNEAHRLRRIARRAQRAEPMDDSSSDVSSVDGRPPGAVELEGPPCSVDVGPKRARVSLPDAGGARGRE